VLTAWQYDKYVALNHFYRPVAWKAGGWTFAVYAHYDRGHIYNGHPTVFATYKGGHNKVHGSHYAHMHKPAPAPAAKPHNNATWRNTGNARPTVTPKPNGHSNANRQIAQNTSNGSRNSHFGGRR
jgi:hypothetical protein